MRCLYKARKEVTEGTIKHGWKVTGIWPRSRARALHHKEIQPEKPEKETLLDHTAASDYSDEEEVVDRAYLMSIAGKDREARYKAKNAADQWKSLRARLAFLEKENGDLRAKEEERTRSKKRKAIPNPPAKVFRSAAELYAKGYTYDYLNPKTRKLRNDTQSQEEEPVPEEVVGVEDPRDVESAGESSEAEAAPSDDEELPEKVQRVSRFGNKVIPNKKYQ